MNQKAERLQKIIAKSGLTSRRKAEQYIIDGRVKVNQKKVTSLGTKVMPTDEISVDNIPLDKEKLVYYVLYKPRGYISAVSDDRNRKTVIDLMAGATERIFPVGRLDYQSSGLLILTNDGDFANQLMHPSHGIKKVYVAKIKGIPASHVFEQMKQGVKDKKDLLKAVHGKVLSIDKRQQTAIIEITLIEGKNRHIRRMMEQLGHPVMKLKREKYGTVTLDHLQPGEFRTMTNQEIHQLSQLAKE